MSGQKSEELSEPGQPDGNESREKATRRRGETLDAAILQAARDELAAVGYTHLTMEGVAARAGTNKAVVYRRWPNKARLVIAAIHKYELRPFGEIPDTGSLREDMRILLHRIVEPMQAIGAETIHGLMVDYLGRDLMASLPQMMQSHTEGALTKIMKVILQNAEGRGEVKLDRISPRVISLPADLLQHEVMTKHEPLTQAAIDEIIDNIFLPLVRASQ